MTPIFKSDALEVTSDPAGFIEFIVHETHELEMDDLSALKDALLAAGHSEVKVLINRIHPYSTGASVLLPPHPRFAVKILKAAYLVYSERSGLISDLVGDLTLRQTPHQIFYGDRNRAIAWLLDDSAPGKEDNASKTS